MAEVVFCEMQQFGRSCCADSRHAFWFSSVAAAAVPLRFAFHFLSFMLNFLAGPALWECFLFF